MINNKHISRILSYMLIAVMLFTLSACGNSGNEQKSDVQESGQHTTDMSEDI